MINFTFPFFFPFLFIFLITQIILYAEDKNNNQEKISQKEYKTLLQDKKTQNQKQKKTFNTQTQTSNNSSTYNKKINLPESSPIHEGDFKVNPFTHIKVYSMPKQMQEGEGGIQEKTVSAKKDKVKNKKKKVKNKKEKQKKQKQIKEPKIQAKTKNEQKQNIFIESNNPTRKIRYIMNNYCDCLDKPDYTKFIIQSIHRLQNAKNDINQVYIREDKYTVAPMQSALEVLQFGVNDVRSDAQKDQAIRKIEQSAYKSQLFFGIQAGVTFVSVAKTLNTLPTLNPKIGFQNFFGIAKKQVGLKIYIDTFIASNILSSLTVNPFQDFISSTFSATNMNLEAIYEVPISTILRFGVSGGFGIGYMTYYDKYWDKLNGFASNMSLLLYLSFKEKHRLELGFRTFFYHYGSYVTRKLDEVVQNPHNIANTTFARPMTLSAGWAYVF